MKKKISVILLILLLAVSSAFAARTSVIQLGAAAELPLPFGSLEEMGNQFKDFGNYRFGADARITIPMGDFLGLQLGGLAMISGSFNPNTFNFNTDGTVNLVFFNSSTVNFSIGAGQNMLIRYQDGGAPAEWTFSGQTNFLDAWKNSPFLYRAGININFGLSLGVYYVVPTSATVSNFSFANLAPNFDQGRVGVSLMLLNLF